MRKIKDAIRRWLDRLVMRTAKRQEDEPVKVWRIAPDGEYGAWQYGRGNTQGGEGHLKDALYQASFLGRKIVILPDGSKAGISESA